MSDVTRRELPPAAASEIEIRKVYTQAELDAALAASASTPLSIWLCGTGQFAIRGSSSVEARGLSSVEAWESSSVEASKYVAVQRHAQTAVVAGRVLIDIPPITTSDLWCEYYGIPVVEGVATLFKAVRDDYRSARGMLYAPGSQPEALDWDGGKAECGGGLHFSPSPRLAQAEFDLDATRFVACPVAVIDIVVHHPACYPAKVKARRVCAPVWECTADGQPIAAQTPTGTSIDA